MPNVLGIRGRARVVSGLIIVLSLVHSGTSAQTGETPIQNGVALPADGPCLGCDLLPEYRSSPLLTQLRGCYALLDSEGHPPSPAVTRCFKDAGKSLAAFPPAPAALETERERLAKFLARDHSTTPGNALRAELQGLLATLRAAAAEVRVEKEGVVSLISQGGISLGSWQAGLVYLLIEHLKTERAKQGRRDVLPTVTGASAGAVNGLIAASASCERRIQTPEESLFYKVWINLGVDAGSRSLLDDRSSTLALFSGRALDETMKLAKGHIDDATYPDEACSVQLGLTLTHLNDNRVVLHQDASGNALEGASQRERFALKLQFQGPPGSHRDKPRVTNLSWQPAADLLGSDSALAHRFPLLGRSDDPKAEVPLKTLLLAVRGSGAFPGAFPPVTLDFRRLYGKTPGSIQTATFIDGGVFDNTPLGLAIQLETARKPELGLAPKPPEMTVAVSLERALVPLDPVSYVLVDPAAIGWQLGNRAKPRVYDDGPGLLSTYLRFVGRFVRASRHAALVEAADRWPFVTRDDRSGLQPRLRVPRRNMPIAGEQLGAFLAFFERDFRIFDFYVGMADAAEMLDEDVKLSQQAGANAIGSTAASSLVKSKKFECMRKYYATLRHAERRIEVSNLPGPCERLGEGVGRENFASLIVAMHNYKLWTMRDESGAPGADHYDAGYREEDEFDQLFRELKAANFQFADLPDVLGGAKIGSSADARRAVRMLMQRGVDQVSNEQPTAGSYHLVRLLGRAGADMYEVLRADFSLGLGITTQGVELNVGQRWTDALRVDLGLRVYHFDDVALTRDFELWRLDTAAALTLTGVIPLGPLLDLELGIGAVGNVTWATERGPLAAYRAGPRGAAGLVLLRRVYAILDFEYFLHNKMYGVFATDDVAPIVKPWHFSFGVGFRWLW